MEANILSRTSDLALNSFVASLKAFIGLLKPDDFSLMLFILANPRGIFIFYSKYTFLI
jgi:hypothetical protein